MPRNPERTASLRQYVTEEISRFRSGELEQLSTTGQLQERFGYDRPHQVTRALQRSSLQTARREAMKEAIIESINLGLEPPKLPRGTDRTAVLVDFVKEELERVARGATDRVNSNVQLAALFGYQDNGNVSKYLQRAGLRESRRIARDELGRRRKEGEGITPSREWAWMLGVLSQGGTVKVEEEENKSRGVISITDTNLKYLSAFRILGEQLFNTNANTYLGRTWSNGSLEHVIQFNNLAVAKLIGDLSYTNWAETVVERHSWVLQEPKFIWAFLEGYFERNGSLYKAGGKYRLNFHTSFVNNANLMIDMLARVGVARAYLSIVNRAKEGIKGVGIYSLRDIQLVAGNIHSLDEGKEQKLDIVRTLPSPRSLARPLGVDELIIEWSRIGSLLGHSPSETDVKKLHKVGRTRFLPWHYYSRFGEGSFKQARINLDKIVSERNSEKV